MLLAVTATLVAAAPAAARDSTGLYEPFPSPSGNDIARRYLGDFGVKVDAKQLERGMAVGPNGLRPRAVGPAARRAGVGVDTPGVSLLTGALVAGALVFGGLAVFARRRS